MTKIGNKLGSALRNAIDARIKGDVTVGQTPFVDLYRSTAQCRAGIV